MKFLLTAIIVFGFMCEAEAKRPVSAGKKQKRVVAKEQKSTVVLKRRAIKKPRNRGMTSGKRAPTSSAGRMNTAKGELDVRGQSRNLNMMLVLKSKQDKISFVELKENYRKEIRETAF